MALHVCAALAQPRTPVVNFPWVQQPGEANRPGDVRSSPAQILRPEGFA